MAEINKRTVDDVVAALKHNSQYNKSAALLIGAGCSITAGIPGAKRIVELIKENNNAAYNRAAVKNYPQCMAELSVGQRRDLIQKIISDSKSINWAHVGMAQLMRSKFVDRILTVNFDPLIMKACATANEYPAVYDFAARHDYSAGRIADRAIFHLHGQHTGFVLLNTDEEVRDQATRVKPVMQDTGQKRTWIICGYSGENDPVFEQLEALDNYDQELFWIGYEKEEPGPHVRRLLSRKSTSLVPGYDADRFFIELCQKLECFPPSFIGTPFSHLGAMLGALTDFPLAKESEIDVLRAAKELVAQVADELEGKGAGKKSGRDHKLAIQLRASDLFASGNFDGLRKLHNDLQTDDPEVVHLVGWSFVSDGNSILDQAKARQGGDAEVLFALAEEMYAKALAIEPNMHEAFYNWGNALAERAKTAPGAEADRLFAQAEKKYEKALEFKQDNYDALYNWGTMLLEQGKTKKDAEAEQLFVSAAKKFEEALAIKPDMYEALDNWAFVLSGQAKTKKDAEADRLFALAIDKYRQSLAIKPDMYEALFGWGYVLAEQAKTKQGADADRLFAQAMEKYEKALAVKPNDPDTLYNRGNALADQARMKKGAEADRLFTLAAEEYGKALAIKPDMLDTLYNWGTALSERAKTKQGAEADGLFAQANEKYQRALAIKPDMHAALDNWGSTLMEQAKKKQGADADRLFAQAEGVLLRAYGISPADSAYNLACLAALRGDSETAIKYLDESLDAGKLPSRKHIGQDGDLDRIRNTPQFAALLKRAFDAA